MLKATGYLIERPVMDGFGSTISLSPAARVWMKTCKDNNESIVLELALTEEFAELDADTYGPSETNGAASTSPAAGTSTEPKRLLPIGDRK